MPSEKLCDVEFSYNQQQLFDFHNIYHDGKIKVGIFFEHGVFKIIKH